MIRRTFRMLFSYLLFFICHIFLTFEDITKVWRISFPIFCLDCFWVWLGLGVLRSLENTSFFGSFYI